ncbi:MAG: DUF2147 domain-containing protein [Bacteroidota bacterium]
MQLFIWMLLSILTTPSNVPSDAILGEYWTEDRSGKIAIYKCSYKYCGRIIWRKENKKDSQNPDVTKRDRKVVGIQFLNDFEFDKKSSVWKGGTVYSIDNGNTYNGKIWLEDNGQTLKMRGFIGFSLLGKTATLRRVD